MSGSKTIIIASACSVVVAAVVVFLLIVILIKIRIRKQLISGHEVDNYEQNDFEATNSFSCGLSVSYIEDDLFADDFKEDKFIDRI